MERILYFLKMSMYILYKNIKSKSQNKMKKKENIVYQLNLYWSYETATSCDIIGPWKKYRIIPAVAQKSHIVSCKMCIHNPHSSFPLHFCLLFFLLLLFSLWYLFCFSYFLCYVCFFECVYNTIVVALTLPSSQKSYSRVIVILIFSILNVCIIYTYTELVMYSIYGEGGHI